MVLVRFAWIFGTSYLPHLLSGKSRRKKRVPWQQSALIAWTGMRGADSLAGALAIPFVLRNGEPFPGRDVIILLTFCVIFATLLVQGLSLAPLVRWLGVVDDHVTDKEERLARLKANEAALARLEELQSSHRARPQTVERLRSEYEDRIRQLQIEDPNVESVTRLFSPDFEKLADQLLQTERDTVIALRNEEAINDQALHRIERDIDLAEARLRGRR
jgi:CPA1 family monovalent cation:H+ antiporter